MPNAAGIPSYVIDLTAKTADDHEEFDLSRARKVLDDWQGAKAHA